MSVYFPTVVVLTFSFTSPSSLIRTYNTSPFSLSVPLYPSSSPLTPSIQSYWGESFLAWSVQSVMWPLSWLCPRASQPLWRLTGHSSAHTLGRLAELPPVASFKQLRSLTAERRRHVKSVNRPGARTSCPRTWTAEKFSKLKPCLHAHLE